MVSVTSRRRGTLTWRHHHSVNFWSSHPHHTRTPNHKSLQCVYFIHQSRPISPVVGEGQDGHDHGHHSHAWWMDSANPSELRNPGCCLAGDRERCSERALITKFITDGLIEASQ